MGYSIGTQHVLFTGDGTAEGYITLANTVGFPVGAIVYVSNAGANSIQCIVTENATATIRVRKLLANVSSPYVMSPTGYRGPTYGGGTNLVTPVAYSTANGACVDVEQQCVPGRTSP